METIKLKINGIEVTAPKGSTILEAARLAHIEIPTLCFLKRDQRNRRLPRMYCRIKKWKAGYFLRISCGRRNGSIYQYSKGHGFQKKTIQLLLSNHNRSCLSCVRSGHCELQELARELGVEDEGYYDGETTPSEIDTSAAHMIRDNSKCILCRRCVAVCSEVQGIGVIGANNRALQLKSALPSVWALARPPVYPAASVLPSVLREPFRKRTARPRYLQPLQILPSM